MSKIVLKRTFDQIENFNISTGFSATSWTIFIFDYVHQTIILIFGTALNISFDVCQATLLLQCTYQIDFVIKLLEPFTNDEVNYNTKDIFRKVYESQLKLLKFVEETGRVYAVMNFSQVFQSSLLICISIYMFINATTDDNNSQTFVFVMVASSQSMFCCFVGQHLTNKFEEFHDKIVQTKWYQFNKEDKQRYLILLHKTQQPVVIRAFTNELSAQAFGNVRNCLVAEKSKKNL